MKHDTQSGQRSTILSRGASGLAFLYYVLTRFAKDRCTQSSAALTYTTLLALVPLLAISFAIFTAFDAFAGVWEQVKSFVFDNFVPQVGSVVQEHLEQFAGKAGQLTAVGVIFLVITSILLLATVSATLNGIWRTRQTRKLLARLPVYWLVLTLTPLLVGAGLVLSLPAAHNYVVGGEWILTTANAGQNFFIGNNPTNSTGQYQQLPFIHPNPKYEQRDFERVEAIFLSRCFSETSPRLSSMSERLRDALGQRLPAAMSIVRFAGSLTFPSRGSGAPMSIHLTKSAIVSCPDISSSVYPIQSLSRVASSQKPSACTQAISRAVAGPMVEPKTWVIETDPSAAG